MFDPNTMSKEVNGGKIRYNFKWATYVKGRRPEFKIHGIKGHATSAIKYHAYSYDCKRDSTGFFRCHDYSYKVLGVWNSYKTEHEKDHCALYYLDENGKWIQVKLKEIITEKDKSVIDGEN